MAERRRRTRRRRRARRADRDGGRHERSTCSWGASTDNGGVTGYQVERCQGAGCSNFTPDRNDGDDDQLPATPASRAGTSYSYRVRAKDAAANFSGYSNTATATTGGRRRRPAGLVAAYAFDEGSGTSVADASGNGNTGTIANATWSSDGQVREGVVVQRHQRAGQRPRHDVAGSDRRG